MRNKFIRIVGAVLTLGGAIWAYTKSLLAALVWIIGLASVPADLETWRTTIAMYDINIWGPWLLITLGIFLVVGTTPLPRKVWKRIRSLQPDISIKPTFIGPSTDRFPSDRGRLPAVAVGAKAHGGYQVSQSVH